MIDRGRSLVIADRTQNLPTDLRRRVEAIVVPKAASRNAGQLRGIVDRAVIAADPAAAKKRQEAARRKRSISLRAGEDGMSVFRAELPADKACTAFTVIDQIALIGSRRAEESRTINALRADAFADIFDQLADHGSVNLHTILGKGHSNCDPRHPCPNHPGFSAGDSNDRGEPERQGAAEGAVVSGRPRNDVGGPDGDLGDVMDGAAGVFEDAINEPTTNGVTDRADPRTNTAASQDSTKAQEAAVVSAADDEGRIELENDRLSNTEKVGLGEAEVSRPRGRMVSPVLATGAAQQVPVSAAFNCGCSDPPASSATSPLWGLGTHQGRTTGLNVTIAATTLAGLDDLPGELDGHGTIPADLARALAASAATVTAVAVNPSCGTALDLGRTVYRPRQAQRDYVNQRDQTCRFPSCRQPAWRCQLDHSDEFCPGKQDGGITCPCNLACLCKFHHDLKTFGLWDTDHHADNSITFTSPTGRFYTTHTREWLTGLSDDQTVESTASTTASTPDSCESKTGLCDSDNDDPPF